MTDYESNLSSMSVGDVLDYSIEVYKKNFKKLTFLALLFYVPFSFVYTLITTFLLGQFLDFAVAESFTGDFESFPYIMLAYYISLLIMSVVQFIYSITLKVVMEASIIKVVYYDAVYGRKIDVKAAIKESFKKFGSLVGSKVLYYLILFGIGSAAFGAAALAMTLLFLVLGMSTAFYEARGSGSGDVFAVIFVAAIIIITILLYLLAAAVVAVFAIKFAFGIHAVVIENKKAGKAISRSSVLTKKSFGHVFFSFFFGAILIFMLPFMLETLAQFSLYLGNGMFALSNSAVQVINSLLRPFLITLLTLIFINLKIKKEGLDLEVKVDKMLENSNMSSINVEDWNTIG